ncbi:sex hormone-binding globulin [Scomber japonicus]|uniref:sex hormone-binding globulin n=1 Tax=Scomber japonicus TaxID=13676 RepID=UPI00230663B1|nr:sex hormone-binding globulin [Scomber japonicus]
MAMFWKAMSGGLLLTSSLILLGWGAEGQENRRDKKEISGGAIFNLGQDRDIWRPLIDITVNLTEVRSIKSSFQLRTYDPEGVVFYGDTKKGKDWFVLSLKDGRPQMQISRQDMLVSAAGGPKLNDGKWHTLEVSNDGNFVILEVDGSNGLVVSLMSKDMEEVIAGELRLALGGLLIDKEKMVVQFVPHMDGCVRGGSWLNVSLPWEADVDEFWPCFQNIQPGSFFPGTGLAIFNTSVFPMEELNGMYIELWGDFSQLDGTILSIRAPGQGLLFTLVANNNTKEVTFNYRDGEVSITNTFKRLVLSWQKDFIHLIQDESKTTQIMPVNQESHPGYLATWREGHIAFGGLLGEGEDNIGSQFLTGCLEKIQVQRKDLDLDLALKRMSISSHSCPA